MAEAGALFSASAADPSLIRFTTGDEAYITDRGYTLWALKAPAQNPFSERRVILNKSSGSPEAGYGVVFCHHASDERMLVAMIDVQGEYIVGEALGSTFTPIVPWTSSAHLKRGYNQDNELLLRLEGGSRSFSLSLNGAEVESFSAIEPEYEPGGGNGYLVVVSPLDRFPASPVGASFRER